MFKKKIEELEIVNLEIDDKKELIKLAKKYGKQLKRAKHLPKNSREMFRVIKKYGNK